jgi:hypothetical protein
MAFLGMTQLVDIAVTLALLNLEPHFWLSESQWSWTSRGAYHLQEVHLLRVIPVISYQEHMNPSYGEDGFYIYINSLNLKYLQTYITVWLHASATYASPSRLKYQYIDVNCVLQGLPYTCCFTVHNISKFVKRRVIFVAINISTVSHKIINDLTYQSL